MKEALGYHKGDKFHWNVYSDVKDQGGQLLETDTMPETNFNVTQGSLAVTEFGNSVPYTGKLDNLSRHPVTEIIHKVLKHDTRKALDNHAHAEFDKTVLQAVGEAGGSINLSENGTPAAANGQQLTTKHVKSIADIMEERNIPTYDGENYICVTRPTTLRPFKDELEQLRQYTPEGYTQIMNGEKGRYEGFRFIQQTNIPSENWASGKSDAGYFFGSDTVAEAVTIPEEIRGKIPSDFGRSKGIAWYALLGYGLSHTGLEKGSVDAEMAKQARIIKWSSKETSAPNYRSTAKPDS
ncbi:MAG: hypothetical protein LPH21_18610 [Shewanella sp.]|nr:hypothetical protein [Shewanella sp.]